MEVPAIADRLLRLLAEAREEWTRRRDVGAVVLNLCRRGA